MTQRPPKPDGVEANPRFRDRASKKQKPAELADIAGKLRRLQETGGGVAFADPALDDRTVAILAGSHLEEMLRMAIITRGGHLPDKETDKAIFRSNGGALSTFSNRIWMARMMGLISVAMFDDLQRLKWIRNEFAHAIEPRSFDDPDISEKCKELVGKMPGHNLAKPISREPARRFVETASTLLIELLGRTEKCQVIWHFVGTHADEVKAHKKTVDQQFDAWRAAKEKGPPEPKPA